MPFDWVVDGDGERALLGLAHLLGYGDRAARDIPAVWSREGGELVKNAMSRSHLNAMPRPDFDGVAVERYRSLGTRFDAARTLLMRAGRLGPEALELGAHRGGVFRGNPDQVTDGLDQAVSQATCRSRQARLE